MHNFKNKKKDKITLVCKIKNKKLFNFAYKCLPNTFLKIYEARLL